MNNTDFLKLTDEKVLKKKIGQYDLLMRLKPSKYGSLAEMKQQFFSKISTYSDDELDLLHSHIKANIIRTDKAMSGYMPVWATIAIALFTALFTNNNPIAVGLLVFALIAFLIASTHLSDICIKKLQFYSMVLELIEKEWENRGHTFYDTLTKPVDIDEVTQ